MTNCCFALHNEGKEAVCSTGLPHVISRWRSQTFGQFVDLALYGLKEVRVYSVLFCQERGAILRFTFTTPGIEEHEWHHTAASVPITDWLNEDLVPLASKEKEHLTADQVVRCVTNLAAKERTPVTAIDWLGLALLASQRYREAAAKVAVNDSNAVQNECAAVTALARVLSEVSERFAQAIHAKLREFPRSAA